MRSSLHVTAVLLLTLLAIAAAVLLAFVLKPWASSPSQPPVSLEASIEAVKAYAVEGLGTYILIYNRNIGGTSVSISLLEEHGISVYIYDWRGDLVAVNTSARIVKEGVRDGVWSPGELVVVEAFVPVVLGGARLAVGSVTGGYRVVEEFGGGSIARLESSLSPSNIEFVEAAGPACFMVLSPQAVVTTVIQASGSSYPPRASILASISLTLKPLNDTWQATISATFTGGYVLATQLSPVPIPFLFTATATGATSGASVTYAAALFAIGAAQSASGYRVVDRDWHTLTVTASTPGPLGTKTIAGVEYNVYDNVSLTAYLDDEPFATLTGPELLLPSTGVQESLTLQVTVTNYTAVSLVQVTYYDVGSGRLVTLSWSPSSPDDQPPDWLVVNGVYTVVCTSPSFTPPV